MTNQQIRGAVAPFFKSSLGTYCPLALDNWVFNPSTMASLGMFTRTDGWVKLYIKPGDTFKGEVNGGVGERVGIIMIEININLNIGTAPGWAIADKVEGILRNQHLSGVSVGEPYTTEVGESGGYYLFMTTAPYECFVGE